MDTKPASRYWIRLAPIILAILTALVFPFSTVFAAAPTVVTDAASDITESTAVLTGTISDFGTYTGPSVYLSFQYCTDSYYDAYYGTQYDKRTSEQTWTVSNGLTTFQAAIGGLNYSVEYHYRAVLRYGSSYVYGSDVTFTTAMLSPESTPRIYSLRAYKDLIETGDTLFVILCDLRYTTPPSTPVSRAFVWSLMDTGTEKGWNVGYAMHDNGYGLNIYSLYFLAADAITWGNTSKYNVQLTGNPEAFYGPVPVYDSVDSGDYAVTAEVWVSATDYKAKLCEDLLAAVSMLEQDWQVVLLDEQDTRTVLSSNGEKLLRNAIPGVQSMAPKLFFVQKQDADVSQRAWGTTLDDLYKGRLLGADGIVGTADDTWIATSLYGVSEWFNMPFLLFVGILCIGLCVFAVWKSSQRFGTPIPGYMASLMIVAGFSMLLMGLVVAAIIVMAVVIGAGWLLFMRRA